MASFEPQDFGLDEPPPRPTTPPVRKGFLLVLLVLTMAAGVAGLGVYTRAEVERLNGLGDTLRNRLNAFAATGDIEFTSTGYGSLVGLHFAHGPVSRRTDAPRRPELEALLHLHMLEHGYTYARRGFIALSLPLGEDEIDGFASQVEAFLTQP